MTTGRTFVVAALLTANSKSQPENRAGMFRFAEQHPDWELNMHFGNLPLEILDRDNRSILGADGFIVTGGVQPSLVDRLLSTRKPIVRIDPRQPSARTRRIHDIFIDNAAIARVAAEHLLSRGRYRSFAFAVPTFPSHIAYEDVPYVSRRLCEFRRILREEGYGCQIIMPGDEQTVLRTLTKPLAVFAVNDERAHEIVQVIRRMRLSIPQDVSIIGVDNDPEICEHSGTPISSVQVDFFGEGYFACEMLDALLRGRRMPLSVIHRTDVSLVARKSTAQPGTAGLLVMRAMQIISREAAVLTPDSLAGRLGISRALLDLRFREYGTGTVSEAIMSAKLAEVRHQLQTTAYPLKSIAELTGFKSLSHLMRTFKREFGMTAAEYRATTRR